MKTLFTFTFLLVTSLAHATTTYWVSATGGNTAGNCAASSGTGDPNTYQRTISAGGNCMASGDTLLIKTGTYNDANLFGRFPAGTSGTRTVVKPAPGATVTIQCSTCTQGIMAPNAAYITFGDSSATTQNLIFDASTSQLSSGSIIILYTGADNIIFDHVDIGNSSPRVANGIGWQGLGGNFITIQNSKIHDNGFDTQDHGLYIHGSDWTITNNEIYNNSGYGVHDYNNHVGEANDRIFISRNYVHNNANGGIIMSYGSNNVAVSNLVINNSGVGITSGYGGSENANLIYGNTVKTGGGACVAIGLFGTSTNMQVKNNICAVGAITNAGSNTTFATNVCINQGTGCAIIEAADNTFVNSASDFHLKPGSLANKAGTTLGTPYNVDYAGVTRVAPYDIGAYEPSNTGTPVVVTINTNNYTTGTQTPTTLLQGTASGTGF